MLVSIVGPRIGSKKAWGAPSFTQSEGYFYNLEIPRLHIKDIKASVALLNESALQALSLAPQRILTMIESILTKKLCAKTLLINFNKYSVLYRIWYMVYLYGIFDSFTFWFLIYFFVITHFGNTCGFFTFEIKLKVHVLLARCSVGVVVITSALHAVGREFDPRTLYPF